MAKKILLVLLLFLLLAGGAFAESRHKGGDILLGIDLGAGFTGNIFRMIGHDTISSGSYALAGEAGFNLDFYLFSWLSVNSGIFASPGAYVYVPSGGNIDTDDFFNWAKTPVCLTIPAMVHINFPFLDFLYLGIGLNFNFPVTAIPVDGVSNKGKFFVGMPIDLGFDFIKAGRGGGRLFLRITPEFHKEDHRPVVWSLMWQIYNFKLR